MPSFKSAIFTHTEFQDVATVICQFPIKDVRFYLSHTCLHQQLMEITLKTFVSSSRNSDKKKKEKKNNSNKKQWQLQSFLRHAQTQQIFKKWQWFKKLVQWIENRILIQNMTLSWNIKKLASKLNQSEENNWIHGLR